MTSPLPSCCLTPHVMSPCVLRCDADVPVPAMSLSYFFLFFSFAYFFFQCHQEFLSNVPVCHCSLLHGPMCCRTPPHGPAHHSTPPRTPRRPHTPPLPYAARSSLWLPHASSLVPSTTMYQYQQQWFVPFSFSHTPAQRIAAAGAVA